MANEIVKYDNALSNVPLKDFTAVQQNIFMSICSKLKDQGTTEIDIDFDTLKKLTNYKSNDDKRFADDIRITNKQLMSLNIMLPYGDNAGTTIQFALFTKFITSEEKKKVTVKVNEEFLFLLNDLSCNFTKFELVQFASIKSKYTKALFRQLKQFRKTGWREFLIEDFRRLLDIPPSYKARDIVSKILNPSVEELSNYFEYLVYDITYKKERGKPIHKIKFHWTPEKDFLDSEDFILSKLEQEKCEPSETRICPICKEEMIRRDINGDMVWCHKDGWKSDAPCKHIVRSQEEFDKAAKAEEEKNKKPLTKEQEENLKELNKKIKEALS